LGRAAAPSGADFNDGRRANHAGGPLTPSANTTPREQATEPGGAASPPWIDAFGGWRQGTSGGFTLAIVDQAAGGCGGLTGAGARRPDCDRSGETRVTGGFDGHPNLGDLVAEVSRGGPVAGPVGLDPDDLRPVNLPEGKPRGQAAENGPDES
jgi:hypothetical protein